MAEGGQSEGAMEVIPVVHNFTNPDIHGTRILKNTGEVELGG